MLSLTVEPGSSRRRPVQARSGECEVLCEVVRDGTLSPFAEEPLEEITLDPAPLQRVLAQLRFPPVASIAHEAFIAPFQERLRATYQLLRPETNVEALFGPEGLVQQQTTKVWRLLDIEEEWSVILSPSFVTLETTAYSSRDDFVARFRKVLDAFHAMSDPTPATVFERLGVRYSNMLTGEDATLRLRDYIRPEMYGPLAIKMTEGMELIATVSQAHFQLDGPQLQARWAKLPPNAVAVPDLPPVAEPSWMLDIDVFFEGRTPFDSTVAADRARHAATHAYRFFRWAMDDSFIDSRRVKA